MIKKRNKEKDNIEPFLYEYLEEALIEIIRLQQNTKDLANVLHDNLKRGQIVSDTLLNKIFKRLDKAEKIVNCLYEFYKKESK